MADLTNIVQDPKFWEFGSETQEAILSKTDPEFSKLPKEAKMKVISKLSSTSTLNIPSQPDTKTNWPREIARTGGGIVGTTLAAIAPGAGVEKIWTMPLAAGIGAAAGESAYQIGQHIFQDPDAPKTSKEAMEQIGSAAAWEGGSELVGGAITKGTMKVLTPFAKTILPEAKEAKKILSGKIKPVLLASEATESKFLDILQNITEGSILGGNNIKKYKIARDKILEDIADDLITQFGNKLTPDEFGDLFVDAINGKMKEFKNVANVFYNTAKEKADPGFIISTDALKTFVKPKSDVAKELGGIAAINAGDDIVNDILSLPDNLTFEAAKELRTRLLSKIDEFKVINKNAPAIGISKKLTGLIDSAIEADLNKDALDAWRYANDFYEKGSNKFNNTFIRRLLYKASDKGQGPEMIGKAIVKPNAIKNINKIKSALSVEEFETVKSFTIQDLFKKSLDSNSHLINGEKLVNNMVYKPTGFGENTLKTIFSNEQYSELLRFAKTLELVQKKQAEGLGRMYIQLAQGAAIATVGGAGFAMDSDALQSGAGVILFGPAILSRMMTKPSIVRLLTEGINLPISSPKVMGLMSRLLAASYRIKKGETDE